MRVAILCGPDFFDNHVGVRSLLVTLAEQAKADGHSISYLVNDPVEGQDRWTLVVPRQDAVNDNFLIRSEWATGTPEEVLLRYQNGYFDQREADYPAESIVARFALGSKVPEDMFDLAIWSAPWVPGLQRRFPARQVIGIVHDVIPNSYVLNGKMDGDFAYQHMVGFRHYADHCDEVWSFSQATSDGFHALCAISNFKTPVHRVIPPILPHHIARHAAALQGDAARRENIVVAVGLFDWRKGLAEAPEIFEAVRRDVHLVICGGIRCQEGGVRDFLERVKVGKLTWYRSIRSDALARLYARARVALFNSDAEGLGLPVLEAQAMGCPVVASDIDVLKPILLPESSGLPRGEPRRFAGEIDRLMVADIDHRQLATQAQSMFAPEKFSAVLKSTLRRRRSAS